MPSRLLLFLTAALTGLSTAPAALSVRVDSANGAPRLVVNGSPVRARMFWGAPGSTPISITPAWKKIDFEFIASASATNGTLHFRCGATPGEIKLADLHVVDLTAQADVIAPTAFTGAPDSFKSDWTFWPTGAQNTVGTIQVAATDGPSGTGALQIKLKAPPDGHWPDFHLYHLPRLKLVEGHSYRCTFQARSDSARELTVAFYRPGESFVHLGGPQSSFASQIKLAADAGINLVSFPTDLPWSAPGKTPDWSVAEAQCAAVLRANPHALLLPRIGMDPPPWWRTAHPDEVMQWEDGRRDKAVVASPVYRREAAERLAALVTHLEEKFGDHIAGYHPTGQNTGEWFYEETWARPLNGYAPADLAAWRQWLQKRYPTDTALRSAWHDAAVTPATAVVPTAAARHAAPAGIFRDPATEQPLLDWAEFQQEAMADCVCELAHAVRQASRGQKLVVFFYGYVFEFGAINNGPSVAGHYALRRALSCPDIDVLCSPISYFDRGLGQSAPSMTAAESVALAGKMWLNEDDTHTYLASGKQPGWQEHVNTLEETNQELTRNVAQEALRNFGTWWMDLGATGWFNDPGLWKQMQLLRALDEPLLKTPTPFHPEIAAVIDERSLLSIAAGGTLVTRPGIYEARAPLARTGAPYGQYLLDDVINGRVKAKLYVFLDAWRLTATERAQLLRATHGATHLWCYAPGYFEGDHPSPEGMQQLTGFTLRPVTPATARATATAAGKQLGLQQPFGVQKAPQPLFAASDATRAETLATYPDGSAAVALRQTPDGPSLFVGAPGLTSELLRLAARTAGVHLFTETDCIVYANGPFVAVHAPQEGPIVLNISSDKVIRDVLTGGTVGQGPKLTLPLKRGETRVLSY